MSATTETKAALRAEAVPRWWLPAAGLNLAIATALLFAPYPPLQDFSEWVYQGALLARLVIGLPVPEISLVTHPVPNSLAQALLALFSLVLPASLVAPVFLLGLLGAGLALALALARRSQPAAAGAFAVVLIVSFFCNATFWNGYVNYQVALLLFAGWFLLPELRRMAAGAVLAFGLLIFLSHAAVFAAFCLLVWVQALADRRLRGAVLGLAPVLVLAGWYALTELREGAEPPAGFGGLSTFLAYKAYTLAKLGPYHNFVFSQGGDESLRPALYWAGSAANLIYTAGLGGTLALGLWRALRHHSLARAPALAALLLFAVFLVLPKMVQHVVNPGERLMIPALLVLVLVVPLPTLALRPLALLGGVALAANLLVLATPEAWAVPVHLRDMEAMGDARVLFRHRPTSFACKWTELQRSEATGEAPHLPISFRTSLLQTTEPEFDCPVPETP
jgi:hypothetical protein